MIPDVLSMLDVFRGEHAPCFACGACGTGLGAKREPMVSTVGQVTLVDKLWQPPPCFKCRQRELQRAAAKRRRENPRAIAGVDVDAAVADLRRLAPIAEALGRRKIVVDVGHSAEGRVGGRAIYARRTWVRGRLQETPPRLRVYGGPLATPADVVETVLHELVHLAYPDAAHGERFRRVLSRCARLAWGVDVPWNFPRGLHSCAAYAMDAFIIERLRAPDDFWNPYPAAREKSAAKKRT